MTHTLRLAAILSLLALGACANNAAFQDLGQQSATKVGAFKTQQADFIAAQNALNAANALEISTLDDLAARERAAAAREADSWRFAGRDDLVGQLAAAGKVGATDILTAMKPTAAVVEPLGDEGSGKALTEAGSTLATLSVKPSSTQSLREIYEIGATIYSSLEKLKDEAKKDAPAS